MQRGPVTMPFTFMGYIKGAICIATLPNTVSQLFAATVAQMSGLNLSTDVMCAGTLSVPLFIISVPLFGKCYIDTVHVLCLLCT